ncbi:hypothetical protein GDO81_028036 [Engystomops pustulosus]|uniref:Uncharacterized protein n=1 Tax=Engystomops pustulosus TaxID=76066 RepID=A0AAV6YLN1_ENGPU|nr:hypothetical protein GDO81_028036 [Engystomops pustulosus]
MDWMMDCIWDDGAGAHNPTETPDPRVTPGPDHEMALSLAPMMLCSLYSVNITPPIMHCSGAHTGGLDRGAPGGHNLSVTLCPPPSPARPQESIFLNIYIFILYIDLFSL